MNDQKIYKKKGESYLILQKRHFLWASAFFLMDHSYFYIQATKYAEIASY